VAAGAPIDVFGVGTRLVTGGDQSALGGVYKLTAVEDGGRFAPRIKKSEEPAKTSWPGRLAVERFVTTGGAPCDVLFDLDEDGGAERWGPLLDAATGEPIAPAPAGPGRALLAPALVDGRRVRAERPLAEARQAVRAALTALDPALTALDAQRRGVRARVAVPRALWERRDRLVRSIG
jgi:nicotinate phosphoribosyltransferase